MKKLILISTMVLALTACGDSGGGAKSTNGVTKTTSAGTTTIDGAKVTVANGVVVNPGSAVNTPYSTGTSFIPEATLGASFSKNTSGYASLTSGEISTSQPFGFGPDCLLPAGDYTLSTQQAGAEATKEHHYQGIVIEGVGPVSFTATVTNVSAKDFQGVWKMQGAISITHVGNYSCTDFGIPMVIYFTF